MFPRDTKAEKFLFKSERTNTPLVPYRLKKYVRDTTKDRIWKYARRFFFSYIIKVKRQACP